MIDDLKVEYYAVCLIDLLGQSSKLKDWIKIPSANESTDKFRNALKDTIGTVAGVKRNFAEFFEHFKESTLTPIENASMTPEQKLIHRRCRDCDLSIQQFSDTFIFYSPICNSHGDITAAPIYRMLTASAMAMITALSLGVPLRGGITVGAGSVSEDIGFYGPGLADAHFLESKIAKHPRVVISPHLAELINKGQQFSKNPNVDMIMRELLKPCQSLIHTDSDGVVAVDYLGKGFSGLAATAKPPLSDLVPNVRDFITGEICRLKATDNRDLLPRYESVHRYLKPRLKHWPKK